MTSLCVRSVTAERSIDGDLCEQYFSLEPAKQKAIADELARTPNDVMKRLDVRRFVAARVSLTLVDAQDMRNVRIQ